MGRPRRCQSAALLVLLCASALSPACSAMTSRNLREYFQQYIQHTTQQALGLQPGAFPDLGLHLKGLLKMVPTQLFSYPQEEEDPTSSDSPSDAAFSSSTSSASYRRKPNPLNLLIPPPRHPYDDDEDRRSVLQPAISSFAQAPSSPPAPPAAPIGPQPLSCPPTPSQCKFYFQGYETKLPTLTVMGGMGDMAISPPIQTSIMGSAMVEVISANTQNAEYICNNGNYNPSQPAQFTAGVSTDQQFYVTQNHVWQRTFQPSTGGVAPFLGKYVRLNLTSVELSMMNYITNLNPGDNSQYFPEATRCVLFQVAA